MGGMEFNKIFAAVLVAGIVAMLGGFIAKVLVHGDTPDQDAFTIEVVEAAGPGGAAEAKAEPVLALIAAADVSRGETVARACAACHTFTKGGANGVGPNLWNTVGGPKEHAAGYAYSGALKASGEANWTYAALNKYLWKPKKYAPGTKMNYIGLKRPEDRAAVIAYLRTLADSPRPMPSGAEIAAEEAELAPPPEEMPETIQEEVPAGEPAE
jgi:cytochrome c